jgi:hypothetical protein
MSEATRPRAEYLIPTGEYASVIAALEKARLNAIRHASGDFSEPTPPEELGPPPLPWHRRLGNLAIRAEDAFYDKRDRLWAKVRGAFGFLAAKEAQPAQPDRPVVSRADEPAFYDDMDQIMDDKTQREVAEQVRASYANRNSIQ